VQVRFRCPRCGLLYAHPADVRNHLQREHRTSNPKAEEVVA
jgi:uncharacterized C2H2 Zn-finger protein